MPARSSSTGGAPAAAPAICSVGLSLFLLHGAPVFAGVLSAADVAAAQAAGAELLTRDVSPADIEPALPAGGVVVYLKDYSEAEQVAALGGAGGHFHRGFTLASFAAAFPRLLDARAILASPLLPALQAAGLLAPADIAAIAADADADARR